MGFSQEVLEQEQKNFQRLVKEVSWFGPAIPAWASFMSIYAIHLGATALDLGLLSSLPALFRLLGSLISDWWRNRYDNSTRAILWPAFLMRARLLLLVGIPLLPESWRVPALITLLALASIPEGLSNVVFMVLIREAVSDSRLIALVSRRNFMLNLTIAGATLALGVWLARVPYPANYQWMFLASFGVTMASLWYLSRVRVIFATPSADPARPSPSRGPWRSADFRRMAVVVGGVFVTFFAITPVVPLQLVNVLGADESFVALYSLLELAGGTVMAALNNRLTARYGLRAMMVWGMAGTGLAVAILGVAPNLYWTMPAALLSGATWMAANLGQFNYFNLSTPPTNRGSYVRAYVQATTIAVFIGPMLGSTLADSGMNLAIVLLIGAGIRFLGSMVVQQWATDTPTYAAQPASSA